MFSYSEATDAEKLDYLETRENIRNKIPGLVESLDKITHMTEVHLVEINRANDSFAVDVYIYDSANIYDIKSIISLLEKFNYKLKPTDFYLSCLEFSR